MHNKSLDVIALGSCYIDMNADNYPFHSTGIRAQSELVGARYDVVPGGSAVNFCRLLSELGLKPAFVGMAGSDHFGELLGELLQKQGVQAGLISRPDLQTNISFNMTNPQGEHIMLVAGTASAALNPQDALPKLEKLLPGSAMVYVGGCFKLSAFETSFADVADAASRHATKLVVDHGRIPASVSDSMRSAVKDLVVRAAYYFPSRDEFCQLWQVADIPEGLRMLSGQAPDLVAVVKDGERGAYYWSDGDVRHVKAQKISKANNLTGAGDSFNAGVIAAITKGRDLAAAVNYGCKVAAARIKATTIPLL